MLLCSVTPFVVPKKFSFTTEMTPSICIMNLTMAHSIPFQHSTDQWCHSLTHSLTKSGTDFCVYRAGPLGEDCALECKSAWFHQVFTWVGKLMGSYIGPIQDILSKNVFHRGGGRRREIETLRQGGGRRLFVRENFNSKSSWAQSLAAL